MYSRKHQRLLNWTWCPATPSGNVATVGQGNVAYKAWVGPPWTARDTAWNNHMDLSHGGPHNSPGRCQWMTEKIGSGNVGNVGNVGNDTMNVVDVRA